MKKTTRLWLTLLLALAIAALLACGLTAAAQETPAVIDQGFCGGEGDGTNLTWTLTDDGTLTISGNGKMMNYYAAYYEMTGQTDYSPKRAPWTGYTDMITTVVVSEGVTTLGSAFFVNDGIPTRPEHPVAFRLPNSLTTICTSSFEGAYIDDLTIPAGVESLPVHTFVGCYINRIHIGRTMRSISVGAFEIHAPKELYYEGTEYEWGIVCPEIGKFGEDTVPELIHFLASETIGGYKNTYGGDADDFTWLLDSDGCLMLDGYEFSYYAESQPIWAATAYADQIKSIAISKKPDKDDSSFDSFPFSQLENLTDVYYDGTEAEWNGLYSQNDLPANITLHLNAHIIHTYNFRGAALQNYVAPTCAQPGGYDVVGVCASCGNTYVNYHVVLPARHSAITSVSATQPTADAHGYTAGVVCLNCQTSLSGHEVIHNQLGAQTVVKQATETEEGEVEIVCTVCGEKGLYALEKLPHTDEQSEDNSFLGRIHRAVNSIINFFLRLIRWLGNK